MTLSRNLFHSFFPQFKKMSDEKLEILLNSIGVEVEEIFKFEQTSNLIVGLIKEVKKHPNSNKLNLCTVNFNGLNHLIVCGANNVQEGKKVIVAPVGTLMLDGRKIEKKEILGIESNGMICSYLELSNRIDFLPEEEKDEIILLDDDAKLNDLKPLKYIGLDDTIFSLSIPSNRNELNGILALGYDLLLVLGKSKEVDFDLTFSKNKKSNLKIKTDINKVNFFGLVEAKINKEKKSTWKIKSFLMNSSFIPKKNIVDISNLIMIITSNPIHAFDSRSIQNSIEISNTIKNTIFYSLFKNKYKLEANDIVVLSQGNPIALAGIVGSLDSSIKDDTEKVVFEVANYNNISIKKTSSRIKLLTESSTIFSKKIPLWITLKAFDTLIILLKSSGFIIEGINYTPYSISRIKIKYEFNKIKKLLGINLSDKYLKDQLKLMGFSLSNSTISPAIYREDITNSNDVVEEILKKIDVNSLKPIPISVSKISFNYNSYYNNLLFINNYLSSKGLINVKTYNLTSIEKNEIFNIFNSENVIKISNPISNEREVMRSSILEKHLEVISLNQSYKNILQPIFEVQGIYIDKIMQHNLCFIIPCEIFKNNIDHSSLKNNLLLIKALLIDLFANYGKKIIFKKLTKDFAFLYKNNSLEVYVEEKYLGIIGQFNNIFLENYNLNIDVFFAEINIDELINFEKPNLFKIVNFSNRHEIKRDLSVIVNKNCFYSLSKLISNFKEVIKYEINDYYKLDENTISYNITFYLSIKKEKITQDDINHVFNNLISFLESNNFKIRKSN